MDGSGLATITDNDPPPGISIADVTGSAAAGATTFSFTVTLSAPSSFTVTVLAATSNGTAIAPGDFTAKGPTTLTFTPGQTTKTFSVAVKVNTVGEATEAFNVNLSGAVNGTIVKAVGVGTITN